jgi:hypothetical protein
LDFSQLLCDNYWLDWRIIMQMTEERRSETRQVAKECYSAEIRLVGVPVYEVKLKNLSSKGACLLFQNNSSLLNHLLIGQELKVKYFFEDRSKSSEIFQAKVKHITEVKEGRFKGYYLAGLSIL